MNYKEEGYPHFQAELRIEIYSKVYLGKLVLKLVLLYNGSKVISVQKYLIFFFCFCFEKNQFLKKNFEIN